jgi:hypothetical protein
LASAELLKALMSPVSEYSVGWQQLVALLYALNELGAVPTRADAIDFIRKNGLLHLRPEDHKPYPSSKSEPSWQVDIAWARKDAVIMQLVDDIEWNSWDILPDGRKWIERILKAGQIGELETHRCCLWSISFRRRVSPPYSPSALDVEPPPKGDRLPSPLVEIQKTVREMLQKRSLDNLATKLEALLGTHVRRSESSVAFAYFRYLDIKSRELV